IKQKSATAAETKDNQALNISDTIVGQSKHQTTTTQFKTDQSVATSETKINKKAQQTPAAAEIKIPTGPFKYNPAQKHLYVIIYSTNEINPEALKKQIGNFNQSFYPELKLSIEALDFRSVLKVEGLKNQVEATEYLKKIVGQQQIFSIFDNLEYRNFIISEDNYITFRKEKNISDYVKFYKDIYLKQ
ncbi:MAG: hypothetical protein Q8862_14730, partial [Bacteroidota bacterium]|nr:hypothetical protein [Bacteroidota bacterium]